MSSLWADCWGSGPYYSVCYYGCFSWGSGPARPYSFLQVSHGPAVKGEGLRQALEYLTLLYSRSKMARHEGCTSFWDAAAKKIRKNRL